MHQDSSSLAGDDGHETPPRQVGVYSMGAVVKMLGIPAATLRTWEVRYTGILPERSAGGHRLYSRDQIEQLSFVRDEVGRGTSPGDAFRLLIEKMEAPTDEQPTRDTSVLVMLAERDSYAAELTEYFLRTEGYECLVALDKNAATEQLVDRPPSLVVVDLLISGGAGLELCREVKRRGATPVVAVSALSSRDEAMEAGADAFLQKPYDPVQFISTVKDLLGTSAYLRQRVVAS